MDDQMDMAHRELFTAGLSPTWTQGVQVAIDTTLMSRVARRPPGAVLWDLDTIREATSSSFPEFLGTTGTTADIG